MSIYYALKEAVLAANLMIPRLNLAIFTFGNASAFDPRLGAAAIKPSGVPYEDLTAENIVVLDLNGNILEGAGRPSSDTATHLELYKSFPHARGIVHTHSTCATAWAQAGRPIPVYGTTHADHSPVDIPCAPIMMQEKVSGHYEKETAGQIIEHLQKLKLDPVQCQMILVEGHGPFTWGESPDKALYNAAVLEELARLALMTEAAAGGKKTPLPRYLIEKHFYRKHGPGAYYGQQ